MGFSTILHLLLIIASADSSLNLDSSTAFAIAVANNLVVDAAVTSFVKLSYKHHLQSVLFSSTLELSHFD